MSLLYFAALLVSGCLAFPGEIDEVIILPGLRIQPTFKHYSGYLNGSNTKRFHYWFLASQGNPDKDPLVLWMNGGPGCSSLDGLLTEHGAFRVTEEAYLEYNPYSWNKIANIIYLESPACVGFSYSTDGNCDANDDSTAFQNYNALKHFYIKFPQFKGRDFYITGESYGGYYVPTLAERIVLSTEVPYIKLKGIAVGNGLSSKSMNDNGNLHFAYNHGLISDSLWNEIITHCCHGLDPLHCDIMRSNDYICGTKVNQAYHEYGSINVYNIYSPCWSPPKTSAFSMWSLFNVTSNYERFRIALGWHTDKNKKLNTLRKQFKILKSLPLLSKLGAESSLNVPCTNDQLGAKYLNKPRVRYALHIPKEVRQWEMCSDYVNMNYHVLYENMTRQYNNIFNQKNMKVWIYNGDVDMACSYLADEWYFETFNRPLIKKREPWMVTDENKMIQVGGFVKVWDKFVLLTIRGSGHMVPTDKPIPAYKMFLSFITGKDL